MFEELFTLIRYLGASPFDCLIHIKENPQDYSPRIQDIIDEFVDQTTNDLYDNFEQAQNHVLNPDIAQKYVGGELGTNELLLHRAMLYLEFEDICNLLFNAASITLDKASCLTQSVTDYLEELCRLIALRKQNLFADPDVMETATFSYDFESIQKSGFAINPNELPIFEVPQKFSFYHNPEQRRHIANQLELYSNTPVGLGRLIQRSNLKLMYRSFTRVTSQLKTH
jgi:hypothetical protein